MSPAEKGVATLAIQRINVARDYVLHHFDRWQESEGSPTIADASTDRFEQQDQSRADVNAWEILERGSWTDMLFVPIGAVHMVALWLCALPIVLYYVVRGPVSRPDTSKVVDAWLAVGPHLVTLYMFAQTPSNHWSEWWFGAAFVVMLGAEVIAQFRGLIVQKNGSRDLALAESQSGDGVVEA